MSSFQAREQVQYNVTGHLDAFSKSLAGEVKTLMKEVGDLRESKRALQHEIADLLLIKARHGGGDGMNLFPWQGAAKVSRPPLGYGLSKEALTSDPLFDPCSLVPPLPQRRQQLPPLLHHRRRLHLRLRLPSLPLSPLNPRTQRGRGES